MGQVTGDPASIAMAPFNGPIEIGLRALAVLSDAFPAAYSLQRLVAMDYLVVHSDDVPGGPTGLHPKTPYRSGELLVRRRALQEGLSLYRSRGLVEQHFQPDGVFFAATERSAVFLDALEASYVAALRNRAEWVIARFGQQSDAQLEEQMRGHLGDWGAEFSMESVLWTEDRP